ncbi:MAG TPA: GNAT family N-acyltransferase [Dissulfurispiraceae bacterium]
MYQAHEESLIITSGHFVVKLAEHYSELEDTLKLRFEVFNRELNEGLSESYVTGLDRDIYDSYCDHLIVIDTRCNRVVGTYRLLLGFVAENNIGYYSENEFDMAAIRRLEGEKLELGRSCVHKDYRTANVISLLWAGVAKYVDMHNVRHLFGCGSLHTSSPSEVSIIYSYMHLFHKADAKYAVQPLKRLEGARLLPVQDRKAAFEKLPPLIKGYVRLGAVVCGAPAYDEAFETADLFLLLETESLIARYRKRFFQESAGILCPAS